MGAFHTTCAFLAVIGKRFGEAGLSDQLVESGVVGSSSVDSVLSGEHYNHAVRVHKLVFEALLRLKWYAHEFMHIDCEDDIVKDLQDLGGQLPTLRQKDNFSDPCVVDIIKSHSFSAGSNILSEGITGAGVMSTFWQSYLDMVSLFLAFIRATREGNWLLHTCCVRKMLPWFFAYDHVNYSQYLSVYWWQMVHLPETHFSAYQLLIQGVFCVQHGQPTSFAQVAVDQCIEQTMNRDSKTKGGIVRISLSPGAVQRWIVTAHERASIAGACSNLALARLSETQSLHSRSSRHKELSVSRLQQDEADVRKIINVVEAWLNPFVERESDCLVNMASGVMASEEIQRDLLRACSIGEIAVDKFITDCLETHQYRFLTLYLE